MPEDSQQEKPRQSDYAGRLQRKPTAAGYRVATFRDVIMRHGVVMGSLAVICLVIPGTFSALTTTTSKLISDPIPYLMGLLGLFLFFFIWSGRREYLATRQSQWILYLLFISIVEEITFRLIFPALLSQQFTGLTAHLISNFLFAGIHYFTLRWRLRNCIVAFLGGMGLSQLMGNGDLTLVVMAHWLGTFLNTPFPPSVPRSK
ncbi:MAG: branched-subunit amino acid transport protein [Halioglobus sp.]|jgi:branched-subunit amino acid transport protein